MDATGNGWVSDAIRCWEYCMTKDTHVLSNSWGGVDYSQALQVHALQLSCSTYTAALMAPWKLLNAEEEGSVRQVLEKWACPVSLAVEQVRIVWQ